MSHIGNHFATCYLGLIITVLRSDIVGKNVLNRLVISTKIYSIIALLTTISNFCNKRGNQSVSCVYCHYYGEPDSVPVSMNHAGKIGENARNVIF